MREPCDYTCPVCDEMLDAYIDWLPVDFDINGPCDPTQFGTCTCPGCGIKLSFTDYFSITDTVVEEVEE